ncbi:MAG TPA: UDP-N-acetylmuramoyl-L-alanyl-D-glutamate--2,6-diaminopimelate ligase [Solimonas sp.]|nr:UDP-N-acetylmuramoyl-L-alanyl-D-glutamate--2,6-diaminopimelate ligase [Solimonas sp.]
MSRHARSLQALLAGLADAPDAEISGVEMDSRRVSHGDLFLACQGQGSHGLVYAEQALEQGAAAIAWEPAQGWVAPMAAVPVIAVEQLSRQAGEIAARYYGHPTRHLFTVGITGTDGKTSTAHLVAQALERLGRPCTYVGTLGTGRIGHIATGDHTTPDPISLQRVLAHQRELGVEACAMEVSSHALDQARVAGIEFDVAVLTNISRDHLDYHGTVEHYAAAKRRLFERGGLRAVVLNRDDARGAAWADELEGQHAVTRYGLDGEQPTQGAYVIGRGLRLHERGIELQVDSSWGSATLHSRLLGRFNACNLLAALAAVLHAGFTLEQAVAALAEAVTVPGRMEAFRGAASPALVVVDYAHTPGALAAALAAARAHTPGTLWCVFGCGGDRDRGKRPLMGAAAAAHADRVIVTDDNPRSEDPAAIIAEIRAGMPAENNIRVIHSRTEAIGAAVREAGAGDTVLVAGKGHEDYQIYGAERRHYSDRAHVAQILGSAA